MLNTLRAKNQPLSTAPHPATAIRSQAFTSQQHGQLADYNFSVDTDSLAKLVLFFLKYEGRDPRTLGGIYSLHDEELELVAEEFNNTGNKYWLFNWKYKHRAWLNSDAPAFLDFGDDFLYWIKKREQWPTASIYLKVIKKEEFLNKYVIHGSDHANAADQQQ